MLNELIDKYIQLRDLKAQMKAKYEAKVAPVTEAMDRIEAKLLQQMRDQGAESFKTSFGTAYVSKRTSATVADWDGLLNFAREQELWNLLEKRVNKTAVDEYVAANEDLPPGVNYRTEYTVNVRRA
jgi:hypothetical protein